MSFKGAANSGVSSAGFKAGFTAQKTAIKNSSTKVAKSASTQSGDSTNSNNQNGDAKVARSEEAQAMAYTQPGQSTKKIAKKAVNGKSTAQDILNRMKYGDPDKGGFSPGSAYGNINNFRASINDQAAFQAAIKGSQETAKAIANGINQAFSGLGTLGEALVKKVKGNQAGGGQQSSGGGQGGAQPSGGNDMFSQDQMLADNNDMMGGGGGGNA
jgi:hypothetical protein